MTRKGWFLAAALGSLVWTFSATASRAEDLAFSIWRSTYGTPQGDVDALIDLHGDRGTYRTPTGSQGLLYGIKYRPAPPQAPQGAVDISGYWQYENGQRGYFTFHVNPSDARFRGEWSYTANGQRFPWNGSRLERRGEGPPPPPPQ